METRKRESTLDEKSLKILKDYNLGITWVGVTVMFNLQSSSFSEIEAKALIEFGRDNNLNLSTIDIEDEEPDEFYQASAFYTSEDFTEEDDEEGQAEEMEEEEKQE